MIPPFDVKRWQPTKSIEHSDRPLGARDLELLSQNLSSATAAIIRHPYDPCGWLNRSDIFNELRYPELALGDAYKARLLCETHSSRLQERKGWKLGHCMGFWMHNERIQDDENDARLRRYLNSLQECAFDKIKKQTAGGIEDEGVWFRRRSYPWMEPRWLKRSDELLGQINAELSEASIDLTGNETWCKAKRHAFGESTAGKDSSEVIGVFAARNITSGQTVLIDRAWGGGDEVGEHGALSSPDLSWIREQHGSGYGPTVCNCRLLLGSIGTGVKHPLDHALIARLTATYPREGKEQFFLSADIAIPNEALQRSGIDVFANMNYDTWVLFTVAARVSNNSCGDVAVDVVAPLYSLINHSCEPNLGWKLVDNNGAVRVQAKRNIRQGEQLFIFYDGYYADEDVEERRNGMWRWLDGPCQCTRCIREEGEPRAPQSQSWDNPDLV